MTKTILAVSAIASLMMTAPAMAQVERHQNQSLNGFSGVSSVTQQAQRAAFRTVPHGKPAHQVEAVGSGNPSLESFNPNAVSFQPSRFGTAPSVAENPDFNWIDQADVGA